jgi:hypothetical protein
MADNADQEWLDLLANIDKQGYDFVNPYQTSGTLPGWSNLDPDMLKTLGVYGTAQSGNPQATAATGFQNLNQGLIANNPVLYRALMGWTGKTQKSNLAAMMLGYKDTDAAKQAGVMDTYGAYLEGILDEAETMKQESGGAGQTRMETIADQVEMGMLDFTPGDDWE